MYGACLALTHVRMHTWAYWAPAPYRSTGQGFAGEGELGKVSFALAYAGDAEYMRVPVYEIGGLRWAQGRACSKAADAARTVASSPLRPTI